MESLLALNLRKLRNERGLTQAGLAEKIGAADATISRLERGRIMPSLDLTQRIAKALRVSVDDLTLAPVVPTASPLRSCDAQLLAIVRDLDAAVVDKIRLCVKALLESGKR